MKLIKNEVQTERLRYRLLVLFAFAAVAVIGGCMESTSPDGQESRVMGDFDRRPVDGLPNLDPILVNPVRNGEICDDGEDNDGDGLIDCDDPDCDSDPSCNRPPILTCPGDLTVECDGSGNQADLNAWLASVGVDSVCDNLTVADDFVELSDGCGATGAATVTWTATDDCGTDTCSATFAIADTTAPVITLNGPAEMTLECHVDAYTELGASAADGCDADLTAATVGGDTVDVNTPGTYMVAYDAMDACGNAADQVTRTVEVVDTLPPEVTLSEMPLIWSPNHEYWTLSLSDCVASVVDLCDGELDVALVGTILSIYSDEPEDIGGNGDGHTSDDIVILADGRFMLRAERQGGGNGRVYGVRFEVHDAAGNSTEATGFVGVPHDQSGDPPIDDGPDAGYTVP